MDATYRLLVWLLPAAAQWPQWLLVSIAALVPALVCFLLHGAGDR